VETFEKPESFCHPTKEDGLLRSDWWPSRRALFFRNVSMGEIPPKAGRGANLPAIARCSGEVCRTPP